MIDRLKLARIGLFSFGALGLAWGLATLGGFWLELPVVRTANRIVAGEPFTPQNLQSLQAAVQSIEDGDSCRSAARRSATIVRLRMAEDALANSDMAGFENIVPALDRSLDRALSCAPTDAFLWMARYWLKNLTEGYSDRNLPMLLRSYRLGPNEAWIAVKRNRLVWGVYERLPTDLKSDAVADLVVLINSNLVAEAADLLAGPAWPFRTSIAPQLAVLPDWRKAELARAIESRERDPRLVGLEDLKADPSRRFR